MTQRTIRAARSAAGGNGSISEVARTTSGTDGQYLFSNRRAPLRPETDYVVLLERNPSALQLTRAAAGQAAETLEAEAARFLVSLLRRAESIQPARTPRKLVSCGTRLREAR